MQAFARLLYQLGTSNKTSQKLLALQDYLSVANDADKVWLIALFTGKQPKRAFSSKQLQQWCANWLQLPLWLFEECYHTVGDLAETIALLVESNQAERQPAATLPSLHEYMQQLQQIAQQSDTEKEALVVACWQQMTRHEVFVFNKLVTGGFRVGVSQQLVVQALAQHTELPPTAVAHLIAGKWDPFTTQFQELLSQQDQAIAYSKPYPFCLAHPLVGVAIHSEPCHDWQAEWKWDGIRAQLIVRNNELFIWSRGEELLTNKFPELHSVVHTLPNGTVLDGEILAMQTVNNHQYGWQPLPFALLQTRINRKNVTKKQLQEVPIGFVAYDIVEHEGKDVRSFPLQQRRTWLEQIIEQVPVQQPQLPVFLSPKVGFDTWEQLAALRNEARHYGSEGLMLKQVHSEYQVGRKTGAWWKWKLEPYTIDAVLIYAQKGHGRRSNWYTDYTFAVKDGDKLVSFAKAYSGLTDKELSEIDAFVKKHAIEKFGPVRTVPPQLVFEIAFEGIAASNRHKSGIALRFPRISRWRKDKTLADINTLADLQLLLQLS